MTLLFEEPYQNGNGKGIGAGGIRSAVKLVKPLFNECLNERIIHYSKKNNKTNQSKTELKSNKTKEKTIEGKKTKKNNQRIKKQSENKKNKKCKTCSKKLGKCNKACTKIKSKTKKDFLD